MDNPPAQPAAPAMAQKPAMKPRGKNPFSGVMPMAIMAFALVAFLLLVFISVD